MKHVVWVFSGFHTPSDRCTFGVGEISQIPVEAGKNFNLMAESVLRIKQSK